jgi:DNA repair protein RecO (recombination protein O)
VRIEQQPAFILHARPYRETSLLLEAFTRDHGRIGLVARGVRRERSRLPRSLLQPLQPLLLDWLQRGELGTLTSADAAGAPLPLAGEALLPALYVNELVLRLCSRNDAHAGGFAAYAQCLARLAWDDDAAWTLRRFERDFLADLGYALALLQAMDGTPVEQGVDYDYDPAEGPRPWQEGRGGVRVSGGALRALAHDLQPSPPQLAELRRVMRATVRHLAGGDLNAWKLGARARPTNG